jgi:hypothetical protein
VTIPTFVLDTGALIAVERADPRITALLLRVRAGQARLVVPDAVVAQAWRGGSGRQARIVALLGLKPDQLTTAALDTPAAKRIGVTIAECGHSDVVDIHVALLAREKEATVLTSDRADLLRVHPDLAGRIIDI